MTDLTYSQAINEAMREEMRRDERVFVMSEDATSALYATNGLVEEFGPTRVLNTPISELGFTGAGVGAAMTGLRPIVDLQFSNLLYCAMDQLVNQAAKSRYLFGGQATIPIVFRFTHIYRSSSAAHHSDRPHSMLMNVPGLKIVAPSTPADAKGLLKSAVRADDPVVCFEDATLSQSSGPVPAGDLTVPLGVADVKRAGDAVTIVAIGGAVPHALAAAEALAADGIAAEVLDPRTLVPLDEAAILASVRKTGRLVVVDPAPRTCSAASEIAAIVADEGFGFLRAPIRRVTAMAVPTPFSPVLEPEVYPNQAKIEAEVRSLLT